MHLGVTPVSDISHYLRKLSCTLVFHYNAKLILLVYICNTIRYFFIYTLCIIQAFEDVFKMMNSPV